jgi:hypothetical protein
MSGCKSFENVIQEYIAGEASPERLESLRAHAERCPECDRALEVHEELSRTMKDAPEPPEDRFSEMRASVMARLGSEASLRAGRARAERRVGWGLWSRLAPRPALAAAAALAAVALLAGGFALGRLTSPPATMDEGLLLREINRQASLDKGLSTYWDNPFVYSNVSARKMGAARVSLSFDVTRHVDVDTRVDSPLVKEVLLHAILDSQSMGSRFEAMELAREDMDPKIEEVMIFTLLNDPSLPVRLGALDILKGHASDPDVRDALLKSVGQDPSVQVRFLALECLTGQHVAPSTILRAIGDAEDDAGRAVLERAEQLAEKL